MLSNVTLTPAYGRDYRSARLAQADFLAGRDFILADITSPWDGKPCSIRDFAPGGTAFIRYRNLRDITTAVASRPAASHTAASHTKKGDPS